MTQQGWLFAGAIAAAVVVVFIVVILVVKLRRMK